MTLTLTLTSMTVLSSPFFFVFRVRVCTVKFTRLLLSCLTVLLMKTRSSDKALLRQLRLKLVSIRLKWCSIWCTLGAAMSARR